MLRTTYIMPKWSESKLTSLSRNSIAADTRFVMMLTFWRRCSFNIGTFQKQLPLMLVIPPTDSNSWELRLDTLRDPRLTIWDSELRCQPKSVHIIFLASQLSRLLLFPSWLPLLLHCRSPLASWVKLWYYRLFSSLYGACGRCSDVTMVNSSWTEGHIAALWGGGDAIQKVGLD